MFERIITRIFRSGHYWRTVSFGEVAELYSSRLIIVFAINILNLFAAVYLYKLGFSLIMIALFYCTFYLIKIPFSIIAAKIAAYIGPKHGILIANLLRIPSLVAFAMVPFVGQYAWVAVGLFGLFQQLASCMYDICYGVAFSKVKHVEHAGKELSTMQIIEKVARVISPLVGGAVASLLSPEATILLACALFILGALPLFRSVEPTKTRARLKIRGFPWRLALPNLVSQTAMGFDFVTSGLVWTLYVAVFVFASLGEGVYAALGGLASLGVLASIVTAWIFGKIVDRNGGGMLLVAGTIGNVLIHLFRPFVAVPAHVVATNIASETMTSAYQMALMRHMFDIADSSGFRITYMMFVEMAANVGTALACGLLALLMTLLGEQAGIVALFLIAAGYEFVLLASSRTAK